MECSSKQQQQPPIYRQQLQVNGDTVIDYSQHQQPTTMKHYGSSRKISHLSAWSSDDDIGVGRLFVQNSTIHGVREIFEHQPIQMRLIWIFVVTIAMLLALYGCYSVLADYLSRSVVVSYFVEGNIKAMPLPDIVVCPFNRFNRSYLLELNVTWGLAQYMELSFPSPVLNNFQQRYYREIIENSDRYEYELEQLLIRVGNMTYNEFIHKASLDCRSFFEEERFCENLTEIMTSAGKCFRIPGGNQEGDGFGYGARIVIKLPINLYNPGINQMLNDGIAVKLATHDRGIDHDLTFIPSGVHAIIPLSAIKYEFLNDPPHYTCEMDLNQTYSRVWCFEICLTRAAEDICNCSLAAASMPSKPNICTTKQFFHCFMKAMVESIDQIVYEQCKLKCKQPCTYWQYQKSVSYARFPSDGARFFVTNDTEWSNLHQTIILDVFYTMLEHTVIRHVRTMTFSSCIAQIGGQISLFMGGSIISIIQLIIYFGRGTWICCHDRVLWKRSCHTRRWKSNSPNSIKTPMSSWKLATIGTILNRHASDKNEENL